MRCVARSILIVVVTGFAGWHWTGLEAWAARATDTWKRTQDAYRVQHAEVFLRHGLLDMDEEIARVTHNRIEQCVLAEQAGCAIESRKRTFAEAEHLLARFDEERQRTGGAPFTFLGREYEGPGAQAQRERFRKDVSMLKRECEDLARAQHAHTKAAGDLGAAIAILQEGRAEAAREGQRLIVERDVADAKATLNAITKKPLGQIADGPLGGLCATLQGLREHVSRTQAHNAVSADGGVLSVEEALRIHHYNDNQ